MKLGLGLRTKLRPNKPLYRRVFYHWFTEYVHSILGQSQNLEFFGPEFNREFPVKPGDVLIDCGANVGEITSAFLRTPAAAIYAFEPNPICFSILSRRFAATRRVRLFNKGVMDRDCILTLKTPRPHQQPRWEDAIDTTEASSVIDGSLDGYEVDAGVKVECIDLDQFILSLRRRVRLLKIDIEGSEVAVLNRLIDTGTIRLIDLTVVETHEKQMPILREPIDALRRRIRREGLKTQIRLDWF
jgi:FkbM family methyltransferase